MKKMLKIALIGIPVVIIALVIIISISLNSIIKHGIETVAPKVTGTTVDIGSIKLSPMSGTLTIKDVAIGNPKGFSAPHLFKTALIHVKLDVSSIFSDTIVIHEINIQAPEITAEKSLTTNNISALKKNIDSFIPASDDDSEKQASSKKVIIEHFLLEGGKVNLNITGLSKKGVGIKLSKVEMKDIGKDSDKPNATEVISKTCDAILDSILSAISGVGDFGKDLGKGLGNLGSDAVKGLGEGTKGVFDGVKGLFGKDKKDDK